MKTVQAFVTEMTRVIRNTDLDDPIQFHAFRQVAEQRITEFVAEQTKEKEARIKFLDDAFQDMVKTNEGHVLELEEKDAEIAELKQSKEQRIVEGKQQEIDDGKMFIKNLQSRINELQRCLGWTDMEPHHPIGSQLGYGEIGKEPDWKALSEIEPPEDNHLNNKAWRGAWLEGQMVGYAKALLKSRSQLSELKALLTRAKDYAHHIDDGRTAHCKHPHANCTCGLEELLSSISEQLDKK